jgi:hypothetical protein
MYSFWTIFQASIGLLLPLRLGADEGFVADAQRRADLRLNAGGLRFERLPLTGHELVEQGWPRGAMLNCPPRWEGASNPSRIAWSTLTAAAFVAR